MSFINDVEKIRAAARDKIKEGPVTEDYGLDREQVVSVLNEALATELVCVLRYQFHHVAATGIHSAGVSGIFGEYAREEQEHARRIARRIKQLGGKPEMDPATFSRKSYTEYKEGESLESMIREDLVAERVVIEAYRMLINFFERKDPTSRRMIEKILAEEEEHADGLSDLLFAVNPQATDQAQPLYFKEEIPIRADGQAAPPQ